VGLALERPPAPRPFYGLDRLAARPSAPVLVVEGEKAADAAATLFPEYVTVTWPGGGKAVGKAEWRALAGRAVAAWPDNDAAGHEAVAAVAKALATAGAASAAVVDVPRNWPDG
jgi:putative DNA primase/helicase